VVEEVVVAHEASAAELRRRRFVTPLIASPALAPGLLVVSIAILWVGYQAGYPPTVWYPGAIVAVGALTTFVLVTRDRLAPLRSLSGAAAAVFGAYTAWSFAAIAWASDKGEAWEGANRTLLYAAVFALFALAPWRVRAARWVLGTYIAGTTLVLAIYIVRTASAADPSDFFSGGRLQEPAAYANAYCALALAAFWPAAFLATRREVAWPLRGLWFGCAVFLVEAALLTQSRGSLYAVPVMTILYVALVPNRARALLFAVPVAAAVAAAAPALLDVYPVASDPGQFSPAVDRAAKFMLFSSVVVAVVGAAASFLDRRVHLGSRASRTASAVVGGIAIAAVIAGAVAGLVRYGDPIDRLEATWSDFKQISTTHGGGTSSRFTGGVGSNRYDFWRVAVNEWRTSPVVGIGTDNFEAEYVAARRSPEEPRFPHSFPVRVLSQTGVVGALVVGAFLALSAWAVFRGRRRGVRGAAVAAAALPFSYWLVHGSVDWFWEFPGLTVPALAFLGLAVGLSRSDRAHAAPAFVRRGARTRTLAVSLCTLALVASLALPWLAARDVDRAGSTWREDPAGAIARLDRASRLNPLSSDAHLVAGVIAGRMGDWGAMQRAFEKALDRHAENWYAHLEVAIAASQRGRWSDAASHVELAQRLNPREPAIATVIDLVEQRVPVDPLLIDREFSDRVTESSA
jgi:hypothetical protein